MNTNKRTAMLSSDLSPSPLEDLGVQKKRSPSCLEGNRLALGNHVRRARDDVAGQLLVDADEDAGVGGLVERAALGARRVGRAAAGDLEVDALEVLVNSLLRLMTRRSI